MAPIEDGQKPVVQPRHAISPAGAGIKQLPLWRVDWAMTPHMQEILHVLAPHYTHMFETVFSRPRPWRFGHLYLPGGSKSLGSSSHELASGSSAPMVTRCVRLRDGKFLVLATGVARFKVVRCIQELPFSIADVELYEDVELLETFQQPALTAVMQTAPDDWGLSELMAAASTAARDACAASSWSWLRSYELKVAAQQEWPGPGPREGESDLETYLLVQELAEHGVAEVLPLPDGVVIGRNNLQEVTAAAEEAVQQVLQAASAHASAQWRHSQQPAVADLPEWNTTQPATSSAAAQVEDLGSQTLDGGDALPIVSLNTVAERGIAVESGEIQELVSGRPSSSSSFEDVLMLEAAVWAQLDTLVALSQRVRGSRHVLPFGLLQLRPPPVQSHLAGADGMDVHADPLWPPLRRAARLSWAAALACCQTDLDKGERLQALLEAPSIAHRLRFVLAVLSKQAKVLAALAAVKDVGSHS
eukprot:gene8771-8950_t